MQWIPGFLSPSPQSDQKAWGKVGYLLILLLATPRITQNVLHTHVRLCYLKLIRLCLHNHDSFVDTLQILESTHI